MSLAKSSLVVCSVLLLCACADSTAPGAAAIGGVWDFTAHVSLQGGGTCSDTGSLAFDQRAASITGVVQAIGQCTGGATTADTILDSIRTGTVTAAGARFTESDFTTPGVVLCMDSVQAIHGALDSLIGTATCGQRTVTWRAVPGASVASLSFGSLNNLTLLTAETYDVMPDLRSATGARLFNRVVFWTTDQASIATVSGTGVITAKAPGIAVIHASTNGQSASVVVQVPGTVNYANLDVGDAGSCATDNGGEPFCWGDIAGGVNQPVLISGFWRFFTITVGGRSACGLAFLGGGGTVLTGVAVCWGRNDAGQLGNGSMADTTVPQTVSGGMQYASISAGHNHVCALDAAGAMFCWGANDRGQFGNGTTTGSAVPVPAANGMTFTGVHAGDGYTCALDSVPGKAYCWGDNTYGQLGDSTTTQRLTPVPVSGGRTFVGLDAGSGHTCAFAVGSAGYCWGHNSTGALGDGTTADRLVPTAVSGGLKFISMSAG
ncbi:MAG TPA: hypothetical protein VGI92_01525, partial [Gemmatimonadales bacterium]